MIVDKEGTSSGLERGAMKKEAGMSEAEHQTEKGKIDSETDSKLIRMDEETGNEKEPEVGEGDQKIKVKAEVKVRPEDETKGKDALICREGDKEEKKKMGEEKSVKEGGVQSMVDAKQGEKQKKLEKSSKNVEKEEGKKEKKEGEEGKKEKKEKSEKKTNSTSGHAEGEKKKEKKDKKSKGSSERIQKKLEKINAKIGRILAKKEEYELRLKEALERERLESEKAALQGKDASTAVMGKSANDNNGPGLRSEGSVVVDGLRPDHDASEKESKKLAERVSSGSLSRTASLIEVTPAELMEEVSSQKRVVEKLAKLAVSDGSEVNSPDSDMVMTGKGEALKHALQVNDSKDIGTS